MIPTLIVGVIAALVVHEAGHFSMARALGYPARIVRFGLGTKWGSDSVQSSAVDRVLVTSAGPLASLLFAATCWSAGLRIIALASLELGLINLIPMRHSDGRKILLALRGR